MFAVPSATSSRFALSMTSWMPSAGPAPSDLAATLDSKKPRSEMTKEVESADSRCLMLEKLKGKRAGKATPELERTSPRICRPWRSQRSFQVRIVATTTIVKRSGM